MSEIRVTSVVGENGGDPVGLTTGFTVGPLTGTTGIGATITHEGHAVFSGIVTASSFSGIDTDKISEGNTEAEVVDTGSDGHFKVTTEGSERMRISSEGYVTKPYNPVFMAYRTSYYATTTSATVLVFDNEKIDVGGNYNVSNGRFTAPVTGLYEFGYASIASNTQTVYRYDLRVNGALPYSQLLLELRIDQNDQGAYGTNGEYVCYVNMTAGQYAQVYVHSDSAVNNVYGSTSYGYTYFRGRLIG